MKRLFFLSLFSYLFIFNTCNKNVDYSLLDEEIILQYTSDNNLNAEPKGSGLYYVVNNTGNWDVPHINSIVTVAYNGTLTDGTVFEQSGTSGATFPLSNVIQGWQEGIPSALGYGNQAVGSIPANSVLIFEVTLLNVN